jgi:hypothetical protein
MLSDGLTAKQADGSASEDVEVLDVAQLLLASVKRAPAAKGATQAEPDAAAASAAAGGTATAVLEKTEDVGAAARATEDPTPVQEDPAAETEPADATLPDPAASDEPDAATEPQDDAAVQAQHEAAEPAKDEPAPENKAADTDDDKRDDTLF